MTSKQTPDQDLLKTEEPTPGGADKSLTLAAKKLAGSDNCLNCGTGLKGPFCYYCGQPDRNFLRFFPVLLRDMLEDILDLDSRFMRTIKPLLFKPGKLTRDYMEGRRFRYAPPMRLYIFSSILFFLLAAFLSSDAISIGQAANNDGFIHLTADSEEDQQAIDEALENLPENIRSPIDIAGDSTGPGSNGSEEFSLGNIQFNEKPWDRETNPVDVKWLPGWINDKINDEIEESPQKAEQINENPNLIIDKVFDILPATMFILLPAVALIFKFWYLFSGRYYVEHLIFSLHNHSFLFVSLILMMLTNVMADLLRAKDYAGAATGADWLAVVIGAWMPLYLLVSLRVVYQQGWFLTLGKFTVIGISYLALLTMVTSGVAIASFVLL